jgi:hypothetical protein
MKVGRMVRALGFDRNPMRRRADRIEAWITLVLTVALMVGGPFLAWRAGVAAYRDAVHTAARDKLLPRFEVDAQLQDDPAKYVISDRDATPEQGPVPARWTAPDGTAHSGAVVPPDGSHAGSTIPLAIDAHGNPFVPPVPPDPASSAGAAAISVVLGMLTGFTFVLVVVRRLLNRRRMAGWQMEWLLVERRWSGRR